MISLTTYMVSEPSARAAFTVAELRAMAGRAGLDKFEIKCHHGVFKMVLAGLL